MVFRSSPTSFVAREERSLSEGKSLGATQVGALHIVPQGGRRVWPGKTTLTSAPMHDGQQIVTSSNPKGAKEVMVVIGVNDFTLSPRCPVFTAGEAITGSGQRGQKPWRNSTPSKQKQVNSRQTSAPK